MNVKCVKTINRRSSNGGSTVHTRKGAAVSSSAPSRNDGGGGLHHMSYVPLVLGRLITGAQLEMRTWVKYRACISSLRK
jgi:hypothetical protein